MIEICIHGRGGQGAQIASYILARAAMIEEKSSQSFAVFGGERRGAPVQAFVRINDQKILLKCFVTEPNHTLVLDPSLPQMVNVAAGLKEGGILVINSAENPKDIVLPAGTKMSVVDGNRIAAEHGLGRLGIPIVNTVMLGAFCGATDIVGLEPLFEGIKEYVPSTKIENNIAACKEAYDLVKQA